MYAKATLALLLAPWALGACGGGGGGGETCPGSCPAAVDTATVVVATTPAMVVSGVQATLAGPGAGTMSCQPSSSGSAVVCSWPAGLAFTPGSYALQVSAPGYQTMTTQVEVAVSPPSCGCTSGSVSPSTVTLSAADGG